MSDKKQIDRLFQEKFKNFEVTPNDAVWENINNRLHKDKRKRRVIPIWWKLGGVAAILLLMIAVGNVIYNEFSSTDAPVVNTEDTNSEDVKNKDINTTAPIVNTTVSDGEESNASNQDSDSNVTLSGTNSDDDANRPLNTSSNSSSKNNIVTTSNQKSNIENNQKNNTTSSTTNKDAVVTTKSNLLEEDLNASNKEKAIVDETKTNSKSAVTDTNKKDDDLLDEKKEEITNKKTIEEAIGEANEDKEKEEDEKLNRWSVTPNVAPVYFNTLGKGSSLDEQFVENSKSGEVNMSYGVGGSYAINKNLKIRAGINKVDLGYSTNNVIAYQNIDSTGIVGSRSHLRNVTMSDNAKNISFISTQTLNRSNTPEIINNKIKGSLDQQFGFIEVPIEIEYAVINKKLGVNVIGGFSTLIVDHNEVYSVIQGNRTLIGEANNLNDISYSANFGLGINYKISKKINVNLEPTFKYQIKTFNNSSGDFQPYFIGVYTGLRFKF